MNGKTVIVTTLSEPFEAFVPDALPTSLSHIEMDKELKTLLLKAENALLTLDTAQNMVQSQEWLLYGFVRKEAVMSSQIEGTQATLTDLLASRESLPLNPDLEEICNYLSAINYAWSELSNEQGLPLSLRLLKETHLKLMTGVRGANKNPGCFRISQNWIGGNTPDKAIFVPPPPSLMDECLKDLEIFFHKESDIPPLIRIGMAHVQFETIHPFLDGNGRLGRLLIAIMLKQSGLLKSPLLYLSLYFKRKRKQYYDNLNDVRFKSSWLHWNKFFLKGIIEVSKDVSDTARDLHRIITNDRALLHAHDKINVNALRLFEELPKNAILTQARVVDILKLTKPPASKALSILVNAGLLVEVTGKKRDRVYHYHQYLEALCSDTQLL